MERSIKMNVEQLKYMVQVAKAGSISVASEQLHITQSAISQSITNLETQLDVQLFHRSRMGAMPTVTGNKIIKKAIEALNKLEEIEMEALQHHHTWNGKLRIGTIPSPLMFLPKTLSSYKNEYPNVQIEITEKPSQAIIDDVKEDRLDIGLIGLSRAGLEMKDKNISSEVVLSGQMIAATSIHSPLAFTDIITPQEIRDYPLVIYNDDRLWEFLDNMFPRDSL